MRRVMERELNFGSVQQMEHNQFIAAGAEERDASAQVHFRHFKIADQNQQSLMRAQSIDGARGFEEFGCAFRRGSL